jgi:hypothetical protein
VSDSAETAGSTEAASGPEKPTPAGWYRLPDDPFRERFWNPDEGWVGEPIKARGNSPSFPGPTVGPTPSHAEPDTYEEIQPRSGWYILPHDPSRQQYWDGSEWTGRQRSDMKAAQAFPGVRRIRRGVMESPSDSQLNEDGTKTCPMCAEHVQAAAIVCRFCGHRFDGRPAPVQPGETSTSGAAIAAFICSLVGLWIAAIPLGIYAQRQIDQSAGRKTGRGFATAGIVLGIIGIVGTIILIIVLVSAAKHSTSCTYTYRFNSACVPGT